MPDLSPRLGLPYILPSQNQKHVTHNEALRLLDALVQLRITGFDATTPPAAAQPGETHALGTGTTGAWAGQDGRLATYEDAGWAFLDPVEGWRAADLASGGLRVFQGGAWTNMLDGLSSLGLNATADATNRLTVASQASLFTHDGAGHQLKINKAQAGDTASLLYQSNWSGRAEMGLAGDDSFSVKVSADGGNWATALAADPATGNIAVPRLASGTIAVDDDAVAQIPTPGAGGFVFLMMVDDGYPQTPHSGIFVYDTGPSLSFARLAGQASMTALGSTTLTGTTGDDGDTSVAVAAGHIVIENRFGSTRTYSFTFLGGE